MTALDNLYGEGEWEDQVYLFNGQCACDPYCGTWVCDTRANVQNEDGDYTNICDAVPCDSPISANPCPSCGNEEDLPFIKVRPSDLASRFTEVDDCCDSLCPTDCGGTPIPPNGCNAYGWTHADVIYHDPELTTGSFQWTGLYGQVAAFRVDSYQVVDEMEADPTAPLNMSYKEFLVKVSYTTMMNIGSMQSGGDCLNQESPNTVNSGWTHINVYMTPCRITDNPDGGRCLAVNSSVSNGSNTLATFTFNGTQYQNQWGEACPNANSSAFPEYIGWMTKSTGPSDADCAFFGRTAVTTIPRQVDPNQLGGYPLSYDTADDLAKFSEPSALWQWETSITYPEFPS